MKSLRIKNIQYIKKLCKIITFILCLLLYSCAGDQKNLDKKTNKKHTADEKNRDRTPSSPRINIPTHTF
jgi:hypothetical protein